MLPLNIIIINNICTISEGGIFAFSTLKIN